MFFTTGRKLPILPVATVSYGATPTARYSEKPNDDAAHRALADASLLHAALKYQR